jgi:hypothetical protein
VIDETRPDSDRTGTDAEKMKRKAAGVAKAAADRARSEAEMRKGSAAGTIDQLASAVDNVRGDLEGSPTLSRYAGELSGSMHGLAERLRSRSVDDLAADVRSLARRNPTVFVAGSIAIGLLGARFLKATARREETTADTGGRDATWSADDAMTAGADTTDLGAPGMGTGTPPVSGAGLDPLDDPSTTTPGFRH